MAWVTVPLRGDQRGDGYPIGYSTYRTMRGLVQMRLTDVSIAGGAQWHSCRFVVSLVGSTGVHYINGAEISKAWGVDPPFKTIGALTPARSVRFIIGAFVYTNTPMYNNWRAEIRWDNSQA